MINSTNIALVGKVEDVIAALDFAQCGGGEHVHKEEEALQQCNIT